MSKDAWMLLERGALGLGESELRGCTLRIEARQAELVISEREDDAAAWRESTIAVDWQVVHHHLHEMTLQGQPFSVLAGAVSWRERLDAASLLHPGRRGVLVSAAFESDRTPSVWHDGALAHVSAHGTVTSYLPSGGDGALRIPIVGEPQALAGVAWSDAVRLEGTLADVALRCLQSRIRSRVSSFALHELCIEIDGYSLQQAVALVLLRRAFPLTSLSVVQKIGPESIPPAWRRLLQNTGIPTVRDAPTLTMSILAGVMDSATASVVAEALSELGDIIPRSLRNQ